ncbi:WYL domain-containing protein [Streptomyces sp. AS02]|uniref:WYL domain-containing protein n=1 Tax=Streptomyces sp. AS02 TaxID=2938946 RepID=UPI002021BC00|nr:WYL domain-containing protein [Streptomyces sp. AS02]MCL8016949.1 WYL domain-containing protein [Streptomyces sp. AS02]
MKRTAAQSSTKTLADLYRAIDHGHAVTITYTDRHGETTVRTIEPFELSTTQDGEIRIHAMCRLAHSEDPADAERAFTISRVTAYTVHRMAFVLERPEPTTYERPAPAPADDAQALYLYELARDRDDADYRPRVRLAA